MCARIAQLGDMAERFGIGGFGNGERDAGLLLQTACVTDCHIGYGFSCHTEYGGFHFFLKTAGTPESACRHFLRYILVSILARSLLASFPFPRFPYIGTLCAYTRHNLFSFS